MPTFLWPSEDGWPYPDDGDAADAVDLDGEADDDLLAVMTDVHLLDELDPVESRVIEAAFGLHGTPRRSVHQLRDELGLTPSAIEGAMGSGLAKLRSHLLR